MREKSKTARACVINCRVCYTLKMRWLSFAVAKIISQNYNWAISCNTHERCGTLVFAFLLICLTKFSTGNRAGLLPENDRQKPASGEFVIYPWLRCHSIIFRFDSIIMCQLLYAHFFSFCFELGYSLSTGDLKEKTGVRSHFIDLFVSHAKLRPKRSPFVRSHMHMLDRCIENGLNCDACNALTFSYAIQLYLMLWFRWKEEKKKRNTGKHEFV